MALLELKDSRRSECGMRTQRDLQATILAIDDLKRQIASGRVTALSLQPHGAALQPLPRDAEILSYRLVDNTTLQITASHYVGGYAHGPVRINIRPRFGDALFGYLLEYASALYVPEQALALAFDQPYDSLPWLLALMWKAALESALASGHIPYQYVRREESLRALRGRLLVHEQLTRHVVNRHQVFCEYAELSADNPINRTTRYAFRLLTEQLGNAALLTDAYAYDAKLASLGVSDAEVTPAAIDGIRYNRMNETYRLLMQISKAVIECAGAELEAPRSGFAGRSFFVDIASVWESYILTILSRYLRGYTIESPADSANVFLLENRYRRIIPDMLLRDAKTGKVRAVVDAKYKSYSALGATEQTLGAVSREDLYQMTTYLWHHSKQAGGELLGLLVSPGEEKTLGDSCCAGTWPYVHDSQVRIGLMQLPIASFRGTEDDSDNRRDPLELRREQHGFELSFVKQLAALLDD